MVNCRQLGNVPGEADTAQFVQIRFKVNTILIFCQINQHCSVGARAKISLFTSALLCSSTGLLCESLLWTWATCDLNLLTVWLLLLPGECHIANLFSCCSGDSHIYAVEHFRFQVFVTIISASSFKAALKTHLFNNYF